MKRQSADQLVYYQFDGLADQPQLFHGIFTRLGGVSRAPFESLNLSRSVGDDPDAVHENYLRTLAVFDGQPERAVTAWLVHGRSVAVVTKADGGSYRPQTDAIITRDDDLALTMRFADCAPVIFYDPCGAIGLAHAGWRGVAAGVVPETVRGMQAAFETDPRELWVGIGPCISVDRYSVGPEVIEAVSAACPAGAPIVQAQPDGSTHLDLNAAIVSQLRAAGVEQIEVSGLCTATRTDEWFSHRAENGKTGRFGVVIGLS